MFKKISIYIFVCYFILFISLYATTKKKHKKQTQKHKLSESVLC